MEYGKIILEQIVIMFIILLLGVLCYKRGLITKEGTKHLSAVELNLVNPLLIFMSYQKDYTPELMNGLLWSFLLSAISFVLAIVFAQIAIKTTGEDHSIERCSMIYSNCAFIGIPLISGLLGTDAVLYLTAYLTFFNFLVWTHGFMTMKGTSDFSAFKNALKSTSVIAVVVGLICFLLQIRIPDIPARSIQYIADVNTPLAMLIAGATVAQSDLIKSIKNKRTFYICFLKLLFVPAVTFAAMYFIPAPDIVKLTVLIAAGCPTATTCIMFAVTMDKNPERCSEFFAVTTLLSGVTLPAIVTCAQMIM